MNGCLSSSKSRPVQNWICQSLFFRRTQRYIEFWGHAWWGELSVRGTSPTPGLPFLGRICAMAVLRLWKDWGNCCWLRASPPLPFQVIDCHVTIYAEREQARWNVVPLQLWPAGWSMFCVTQARGRSPRPKGLSSASGIHSVTLTDWLAEGVCYCVPGEVRAGVLFN